MMNSRQSSQCGKVDLNWMRGGLRRCEIKDSTWKLELTLAEEQSTSAREGVRGGGEQCN